MITLKGKGFITTRRRPKEKLEIKALEGFEHRLGYMRRNMGDL